ncbi:MAG TPA: complex I NDUFA9 subunit family protein [Phycisphaerae bacterium]|nr:complex I NDUFA9 subunit family protein [Phycisphaerae bacterium]
MPGTARPKRVFLTGTTGFVGRYVLRELLDRGHEVVCLIRSDEKFRQLFGQDICGRVTSVRGTLFDDSVIQQAVADVDAIIHLVGIIREVGRWQTFDRIHRQGTKALIRAAVGADVRRFVHMSALGARSGAVSKYHRSKWAAERYLHIREIEETILRPSVIHGPDGEFMQLLKTLACGLVPPVMPYFGSGKHRVQPVSVRDVARCFVEALHRPETIGKAYELGGPRSYTWRELYAVGKRLIPGARRWKPCVGQPVWLAELLAATVMRTPLVAERFKFNRSQVQMSQEDSVCDHTVVESAFGIRLRDFEAELAEYAAQIA